MPRNDTRRRLRYGDGAWRELQEVIRLGYAPAHVFSDWLELMLTANLSLTDNYGRKGMSAHQEAFDGVYEARYAALVALYPESAAHDHFVRAYEEVSEATAMCRTDVLGELYAACMKQAGWSRVPAPVLRASQRTVMFKSPRGVDRILDPACGSGARLIEAGKRDPGAELHGIDVDPDCVTMCALNMTFLRFRAVIQQRSTAVGVRRLAWSTSAGLIAELNVNKQMAPARYGIALHGATRSNLEIESIRKLGSSPTRIGAGSAGGRRPQYRPHSRDFGRGARSQGSFGGDDVNTRSANRGRTSRQETVELTSDIPWCGTAEDV